MRIASFSRTDMVTWPGRQVSVLVVDGSDGPGEDPEAVAAVAGRDTDIVVTFGAGDIDRLVQPLEDLLRTKYA